MAKEFDLFLHRHLIQCNLLLRSIPFRDGISVTDRMILDAMLKSCRLIKMSSVKPLSVELSSKLDGIVKTCRERLGISVEMDASADFEVYGVIPSIADTIELSAENLDMLATTLNHVETNMLLAAELLDTKISKSLGTTDTAIVVDGFVTDTLKHDFLTPNSDLVLGAMVDGDVKTGLLNLQSTMLADATLRNLCKRVTIDAVDGFEMVAILLGTSLRHSLGRCYPGIAINAKVTGTKARKLEVATGIIEMMTGVQELLTKFISIDADQLVIDAEVEESRLKRYRLLSDLDDSAIGELDNMTLDDLDYVILAG